MSAKQEAANVKIRTIITGATGMVGEGVLHECLLNPTVEEVLAINRKPCGIVHPKLTEIIHENFFALSDLGERLAGYNACFFCLGVSSAGMKEETYYRLTHDLTLHAAELLAQWNPDMVFCYVTAAGTDRTEQGRSMWARVKGKTENDLLKLPFRKTYFIRPAFIRPTPGSKRTHKYYYAIGWLYPLLRPLFPQYMISLPEIGQAMIELVNKDYPGDILESCDIAAIVQKIN